MELSPRTSTVSRRTLLGLAATGALGLSVSGCGPTAGSSSSSASDVALPTFKAQPAAKGAGAVETSVEMLPQIYTKRPAEYWHSVTKIPGRGGELPTFQMLWFAPPAAVKDNPVWQQINKKLNIQFKPTLASADTYNNKLATLLAGGKVPDLLFVQDQEAVGAQAIDQGAFADLTDVVAGDNILKWPNLANLPTYGWKNSRKKGRTFGIPHVNPAITKSPTIRTDLMKAVGHDQQPETSDDLLTMFTEIAKLKTHQGKQVWGIGGLGTYQIEEMVRWMFGVGPGWRLSDDGKLTTAVESEEYVEALEYLTKLWKAKAFHPDALALGSDSQRSKEKQLWSEGHFAFELDAPPWLAQQGMEEVEKKTKGAKVDFLIPPAAPDRKLVVPQDPGYWGIVAISADAAKDKERVEELLSICNYFAAPFGTEEALFLNSGIEGYNYTVGKGGEIVDTEDAQATTNLQGLRWLGANAPSYILLEDKNAHRKGALVKQLELLTKASLVDPTVGLISEAGTRNSAQLQQINDDWRTKIVTGREPLTAIDEWRAHWRKAGGDEMRKDLEGQLAEK